jgi:hypothetical protein
MLQTLQEKKTQANAHFLLRVSITFGKNEDGPHGGEQQK